MREISPIAEKNKRVIRYEDVTYTGIMILNQMTLSEENVAVKVGFFEDGNENEAAPNKIVDFEFSGDDRQGLIDRSNALVVGGLSVDAAHVQAVYEWIVPNAQTVFDAPRAIGLLEGA